LLLLFVVSTSASDCLSAGFLQVRENWKNSGNLSGQGKSGKGWGKISFVKVRENDKLAPPDVRFLG